MSQINLNQMLLDIRTQCQHIVDGTARFDRNSFDTDLLIRSGFERFLLNVGESAVRLREELPDVYEEFPGLANAIGLRNRLAHGYENDIDQEIIWDVITVSIPKLIADIDSYFHQS